MADFPRGFKIGKIAQVAFVVRDLEARMQAFWEDFGIGPWSIYAFEPPRVKDMTYRGQHQDFRMRVAFAMCGDTSACTSRTWTVRPPDAGPRLRPDPEWSRLRSSR